MQVTISKAAKMAGVSRATIYNDIESGTLSVERGVKDRKMVNISELERVYKSLKNPDNDSVSKPVENSKVRHEQKKSPSTNQIAVLQERLETQKKQAEHLEELLQKEQDERKREREAAKQFEEYFKTQIENQSESIKNFTKLLEDQRSSKDGDGAGEWETAIKNLEERIANKETETQKAVEDTKRKAQAQISKYKKELEEEKSKGFFKRLFG